MPSDPGAEAATQTLQDLPPSAKLVAKVLEYEEGLTQAELTEETLLCGRTVRYAIGRLERIDLLDSRTDLRDARRTRYWIDGGVE